MKIAEAVKGRERPMLKKLIAFMESLPKDEVFPTKEIADRLKGGIHNFRNEAELAPYCALHSGVKYWGSKPAIQAFRAAIAKAGQ